MKILVTGGSGFIGSNIAMHFVRTGHEVIITGNETELPLDGFSGKVLHPSFIGLDWDSLKGVDVVFHQAAINDTQNKDRSEIFRANFDSSVELFTRAIAAGCKRIVYATSTAVYGGEIAPYVEGVTKEHPLNPYAEAKLKMEKFATKLSKDHPDVVLVGLRYCNVYGKGENKKGKRATMIYQLAHQMLKGNPKIFTDGEQKRDYCYIKDIVAANVCASQAKQSCIVNCGLGQATTFNELIRILNKILGVNRTPEYIDNPYGSNYQAYTECNMSLAKELIGFIPKYDVEAGIKDYFDDGDLLK